MLWWKSCYPKAHCGYYLDSLFRLSDVVRFFLVDWLVFWFFCLIVLILHLFLWRKKFWKTNPYWIIIGTWVCIQYLKLHCSFDINIYSIIYSSLPCDLFSFYEDTVVVSPYRPCLKDISITLSLGLCHKSSYLSVKTTIAQVTFFLFVCLFPLSTQF